MPLNSLRSFLFIPLSILAARAFGGQRPVAAPDDPACTAQDRIYMARAYELARYATTHGGGPFGALLVKDGKILAEFSNCVHSTGDVTKHAETGLISAFSPRDRPGDNPRASTLYTEHGAVRHVLRCHLLRRDWQDGLWNL